eukprot:30871-Pelagococcus_subviridis.AAC.27
MLACAGDRQIARRRPVLTKLAVDARAPPVSDLIRGASRRLVVVRIVVVRVVDDAVAAAEDARGRAAGAPAAAAA